VEVVFHINGEGVLDSRFLHAYLRL
jgi:hypothetical protein